MKDFYKKDNPIANLVSDALQNIREYVDMDTIVGKPIEMDKSVVAYPIIKVTLGVVAGGGQYSNKLIVRKMGNEYPFAGGTGAGFTAEPIGFLIINHGQHQLITIQNENAWADTLNKVGGALSDYLNSLSKSVLKKSKKEE